MNRTSIIQSLITKNNYKSYLEIGYQKGVNYNQIVCEKKISVDPDPDLANKVTFNLRSDDFFVAYGNLNKIDCIFIDGMHEYKQVYRDIINSLNILSDGGTIVCHDMNPTSELMQTMPRNAKVWTGDCWKAWLKLRQERFDLEMRVVGCDFGCGIIRRGKQHVINIQALNYFDFNKNRTDILNLISESEFDLIYL